MAVDPISLLAERDMDAPLAWVSGEPVSGLRFLADATRLAAHLPSAGSCINLCTDRYDFAVGLAAALRSGQTSLLPPNALPETLGRLRAGPGLAYALVDGHQDLAALETAQLPSVRFERLPTPGGAAVPDQPVTMVDAAIPAVCLLTSGSTGDPQPHAKTWAMLTANVRAAADRLAASIDRPSLAGLNVVATVPAQHSYGLESSVLLALLGGAAFDAGRPFYPADISAALARLPHPRALVTTPFHLKTLLLSGVALPPTDLILCATAPLSPRLAQQAERQMGGRLVEIYGCTEAGQVATRRPSASDVWQTFGALRIHRECGPAESREDERFIVQGGHVTEPTPLADVLQLVDDRHFRLLGRANDLIHVAGKRTSLAFLNYQLSRIDGVHDGAFWLPDDAPDGVVRPVAFVVAPGLAAAAIVSALRPFVEPAFLPRRVVHVQALPREATGKLGAESLRRFAAEHLRPAES